MAAQMGGQPILILSDKTQRTVGRDAQRTNILAAKIIAESVKTTLGPRGMDKMLVDSLGDVVVTNDGVTILKEMDVEHPAAKMMVEVAKTQDDEVGDGTTTAVVLAGELLKRSEELLEQDVHPTIIAGGYRLAAEKAQKILDKIATPISVNNQEILKKVATTAMTGKGAEKAKEYLANLVVKAVNAVAEIDNNNVTIDTDHIKIEKKEGGGIEDTALIQGVIVDKERVHTAMPKRVKKAKIALINSAMEVKETEIDAEIRITDPNQLKAFIDEEEKMLRDMVDQIKNAGTNVLLTQKGIDDLAQHYLAKEGIFAVRRVKKSDMEKLNRATGANIVTNIEDLSSKDLGYAGIVEEVKIGDDEMIYVKECKDPKSVSILVRGGTEHIVDEVERALEDCLGVVPAALIDKKVLGGGGAPEVEVAKQLREYAKSVGGREQLAIEAFANSLEVIPRALAENAGLDPIDVIVDLRSKHEKTGAKMGIDVYNGKVKDMFKEGVIEPLRVKTQAIDSASEVAVMVLRIDDVIASKGGGVGGGPSPEEMAAMGGGMGGMGGMGM
ncbi:MAG: thermosome subunit beta [Candidatus Hydrothermarchaeota archaeon]|nr:thermosome subunit beta [Candidatus Hydrothermarchaeota archaeon]